MKQGLVLSDLHLFTRRSRGEDLLARMNSELTGADVLVLNGDIFDFSWSRLPSENATIMAALQWLTDLADAFQGETIHYILGNHDCVIAFRDALDGLSRQLRPFHCHEHRLHLGRALFLHGDCANWKMCAAALARQRDAWNHHRPRTRVHSALYDLVDRAGLCRWLHEHYFPQSTTVKRVAHHLDHVMPDWRRDVDDCYFGHTHLPFRDYHHDGVRFHNTGSGIRGMEFQPITFELKS